MTLRQFNQTIEFTNDGKLSLFFLGTGSAFSKKYYQNNLLIIKGQDHILVDCGTLCSLSFNNLNSKISDVKNLLITHSHADHAGGLEEIALTAMYFSKEKINLVICDDYKKRLWNDTLKGGCEICGEEDALKHLTLDDYFNQIKPTKIRKAPRPFFEANIGSINLKLFRTKHSFSRRSNWKTALYSVGILIDNRILFTSDSKFDIELLNWMEAEFKPEYIFHDCSFAKNAVHAWYEELKTLPAEMKKKTFLCHYNDSRENYNAEQDGFAGFVERAVYYDF